MRKSKHGLSYTPGYKAWQQMRLRCLDPKHARYADYGGRGITVCDRWKDSPVNFIADMGPCPPGHELDRIDNNKGYEPSNCRWVTREVNGRNRRSNRLLTMGGETRSLAEWAQMYGLNQATLLGRIDKQGWSSERAITTPSRAMRAVAKEAACGS